VYAKKKKNEPELMEQREKREGIPSSYLIPTTERVLQNVFSRERGSPLHTSSRQKAEQTRTNKNNKKEGSLPHSSTLNPNP
jgi:hypothetical protein